MSKNSVMSQSTSPHISAKLDGTADWQRLWPECNIETVLILASKPALLRDDFRVFNDTVVNRMYTGSILGHAWH